MATPSIKIARELPFKIEEIDQGAGRVSWNDLAKPPYNLITRGYSVALERWSVVFTSAVSRAYDEIFSFDCYGIASKYDFAFGALDYKGDAQMLKAIDGLIRYEEIEVGDYVLWVFDRPFDFSDRNLYQAHLDFLTKKRTEQEAEINKAKGAPDYTSTLPSYALYLDTGITLRADVAEEHVYEF